MSRRHSVARARRLHAGRAAYGRGWLNDDDRARDLRRTEWRIARSLWVNPGVQLTAIVRGAEVSNDASMVDARQVGLEEVARVIPNGSDIAGTSLAHVNDQTRSILRESDLVISKGLANYETLLGKGQNTYFLFLCKCALYVECFDVPLYTGMVVRGV